MSFVDRLLNDDCLRCLALADTDAVLDVGCGFGEFTRAMGRRAGRVVAVERDAAIVTAARSALGDEESIDFRVGDAGALPLRDEEWGSFDVAHARFVLESLAEPARAVAQMLAAVRPGGRVLLFDDDHEALRLWPDAPRVTLLWRAYMRAFDAAGNDSIVGRKLVSLLYDGGAQPTRAASLTFGTSAGEPSFGDGVARLRTIFETERRAILATNLIDATAFAAVIAELQDWAQRPDATIWYVVRQAEGRRSG